jgi:hypothetical protein
MLFTLGQLATGMTASQGGSPMTEPGYRKMSWGPGGDRRRCLRRFTWEGAVCLARPANESRQWSGF